MSKQIIASKAMSKVWVTVWVNKVRVSSTVKTNWEFCRSVKFCYTFYSEKICLQHGVINFVYSVKISSCVNIKISLAPNEILFILILQLRSKQCNMQVIIIFINIHTSINWIFAKKILVNKTYKWELQSYIPIMMIFIQNDPWLNNLIYLHNHMKRLY